MNDIELVHFELNNWFSGRDYPNEEPFASWVTHHAFSNDEWCKKNKLVVLSGNIDMSANWCITAPKEWVKENCPALLYNKKYKYTVIQYSKDGSKKIEYEKSMSDFIRHPDEDGDVYGRFDWHFPEYCEENYGVHFYDKNEYE